MAESESQDERQSLTKFVGVEVAPEAYIDAANLLFSGTTLTLVLGKNAYGVEPEVPAKAAFVAHMSREFGTRLATVLKRWADQLEEDATGEE